MCVCVCACSEFGEEDVDKVKAAVKMFVHSCAGYSVATYVLVRLQTNKRWGEGLSGWGWTAVRYYPSTSRWSCT